MCRSLLFHPFIAVVLAACSTNRAGQPQTEPRSSLEPASTFSIVALDPESGDLGVAVQSKFFGVGAVVPWVEAGTGAVATQSYANTSFGPRGLGLLREGRSPQEVARKLLEADPETHVTLELERRVRHTSVHNSVGTTVTTKKAPLSITALVERVKGDDVLLIFRYFSTAVKDEAYQDFALSIAHNWGSVPSRPAANPTRR